VPKTAVVALATVVVGTALVVALETIVATTCLWPCRRPDCKSEHLQNWKWVVPVAFVFVE